MEITKLAIVFIVIVGLIRFKLGVGVAIYAGAILLGLLFGQNVVELGKSLLEGMFAWHTFRLILIVTIVSIMGSLLKNLGITPKLVNGVANISGSIKLTMILCPAIIGLMPMPGGALLSAPLVEAAAEGQKISRERLTVINYWFRHIFEYCWPIFPGIILSAAILKVDVTRISMWQAPLSVAYILGGLIFLILPLKNVSRFVRNDSLGSSWKNVAAGVWPILLVVVITFSFGIDILISLAISFALFLVITHPPMHQIWKGIVEGCSFGMISLMFGIMVFQSVINDSGAAVEISSQIASWGVPDWVVLSLSCFLLGIVTGIITGYVGVAYPILIAMLVNPDPRFSMIVLAFGAGHLGVMISPLHLCLILTKEYFKAGFSKIYPLILGPIFVVALVLALILGFGYGGGL